MAARRTSERSSSAHVNPLKLMLGVTLAAGPLAMPVPLTPSTTSQPSSPSRAMVEAVHHQDLNHRVFNQNHFPNENGPHLHKSDLGPGYVAVPDLLVVSQAQDLTPQQIAGANQFFHSLLSHISVGKGKRENHGQPGYNGTVSRHLAHQPAHASGTRTDDGFGNCTVAGSMFQDNSFVPWCKTHGPRCNVPVCQGIVGTLAGYLALATFGSGPILAHFGYLWIKRRNDPEFVPRLGFRHALGCIAVGIPTGALTTMPASIVFGCYYVYREGSKCVLRPIANHQDPQEIELQPVEVTNRPAGVTAEDDRDIAQTLVDFLQSSPRAGTGAAAEARAAHGPNAAGPS